MTIALLSLAILVIAVLYSSVGHAGASGYLAAMALVGMAPDQMRPTALVLNVLVATIGSWRFARAGHFSWPTLWPFLVTALPLAALSGSQRPPAHLYKPLVGVVLLWAGFSLLRSTRALAPVVVREEGMPHFAVALPVGAAIGVLAGLTGTGGGIFLSPVLIALGWASPHRTAGVSAVFVLLVSIAGLLGFVAHDGFAVGVLPRELPVYLFAAVVGGTVGAGLGARQIQGKSIRVLLGVVLLLAAAKMFVTAF